jgi:ribonuclease P protein component
MILSKLKLKKRDFDRIFIKKETNLLKIIRNNYFDLKIFESNDFKVSVIVSSKTESGAVNRNKIKRRFYFIIKK